jgi:hypothetical protein
MDIWLFLSGLQCVGYFTTVLLQYYCTTVKHICWNSTLSLALREYQFNAGARMPQLICFCYWNHYKWCGAVDCRQQNCVCAASWAEKRLEVR